MSPGRGKESRRVAFPKESAREEVNGRKTRRWLPELRACHDWEIKIAARVLTRT